VLPRRGMEAASYGSEATVTTIVPKLKSNKNKMYDKINKLQLTLNV
jgi:hypothetical protein